MKTLLIVTDHRFYEFDGEIYDNYVFDYSFFKDYLSVFDAITVVGRVKSLEAFPKGYLKTTGINLDFVKIQDERGIKWFFLNKSLLKRSRLDLARYDAICYRIPSVLSRSVWRNARKYKIPHMFEMIGHPTESMQFGGGVIKKTFLSLIGNIMHASSRNIVKTAVCGSYVTFNSLQESYPASKEAISESISSIRLEERYIKNELLPLNLETISIVHLGSFVPIKNQNFLIEFVGKIKNKYNVRLTFLGGGPLLEPMKEKVITNKWEDIITFKGHIVGFDNIVRELDKNNFFILPSHSEGMPRAMIEAMARGLICFGSKRGGISELLQDEYLFDPLDVDSLIAQFENSIKSIEKLEENRGRNLNTARLFEKNTLTKKRVRLLTHLINSHND